MSLKLCEQGLLISCYPDKVKNPSQGASAKDPYDAHNERNDIVLGCTLDDTVNCPCYIQCRNAENELNYPGKFIKKLVQISRENKNKLSKIEKPYASLFSPYGGESFTVQCDGKSFSCKMLCGRNVKEPLIFSEEGYMEFTFSADVLGYDLFQYKKRFEFDYSSPYKKIIIMNSMPRKVLLNWESKQIPLESGDRFGEYILYNETDFLNALNRDVLGR